MFDTGAIRSPRLATSAAGVKKTRKTGTMTFLQSDAGMTPLQQSLVCSHACIT